MTTIKDFISKTKEAAKDQGVWEISLVTGSARKGKIHQVLDDAVILRDAVNRMQGRPEGEPIDHFIPFSMIAAITRPA